MYVRQVLFFCASILSGVTIYADNDSPSTVNAGDSRFGINGSQKDFASKNRQVGFRLVRFENMKWFMCSKARGHLEFNGSVGPWFVNHDEIIRNYVNHGLEPVPMMLGVPLWASSRPQEKRGYFYPPTDPNDYRDFAFQIAARYGSRKHPAEKLLPQDHVSGLNLIRYFEIWNEPDLNHPQWGALVGSFEDYYPILRAGYEGIKQADPAALVLNGGLAGFHLERWEEMRKFKYPDGKSAIDFIDIINIHYYCGKRTPEQHAVNTNVDRSGTARIGPSFAEEIDHLVRWRDRNKPQAPIWLTETGWDTIGGHFVSEKQQAAYLVRAAVIALSGGIDKLFIYREGDSGNTLYASCGLFRKDGTPKPSMPAVANLLKQIGNATPLGRVPQADPAQYAYLFRQPDRNYLLVAWGVDTESKAPDQYRGVLTLKLPPQKIFDSSGTALPCNNRVELGMFPVFIVPDRNEAEGMAATARAYRRQADERFARDRQRRAVILDFGDNAHVGIRNIGGVRQAVPVTHQAAWSDGGEYGFVKGAVSTEYRHWIPDLFDCDGIKTSAGAEFRIKLPVGKFRMELGLSPFDGKCGLLTELNGKEILTRSLDGKARTLVRLDETITVKDDGAVLTLKTLNGYCLWHYLVFTEIFPEDKSS